MFSPGPGTYDAKPEASLQASPGWRLGTSTRHDVDKAKMRTSNFPPPDSYNPNYTKLKKNDPKWGFGSGTRAMSAKLKTPAPGTYNIPGMISHEGPTFKIGLKLDNQSAIATEQRKVKANPGPGSYQPEFQKTVRKEAAYTLKSRPTNREGDQKPGPGAYAPGEKKEQTRAPTYRFGSSAQRGDLVQSKAPGPGSYHIPSTITNMPAYTGARSKDFGYI
jgi:hypothetical protein